MTFISPHHPPPYHQRQKRLESTIDSLYDELILGRIRKSADVSSSPFYSRSDANGETHKKSHHRRSQNSAAGVAAPISKRQKQRNLLRAYASQVYNNDLAPFETPSQFEHVPMTLHLSQQQQQQPETSVSGRSSFRREPRSIARDPKHEHFGLPSPFDEDEEEFMIKTDPAPHRRPRSAHFTLRKSSLLAESERNLQMDLEMHMEEARRGNISAKSVEEALRAELQSSMREQQQRPQSAGASRFGSSRKRVNSPAQQPLNTSSNGSFSSRSQRQMRSKSNLGSSHLSRSVTASSLYSNTPRKSFGRSVSRENTASRNDNPMYSTFGSTNALKEVYQAAQKLKKDPNAPDYLRVSMNIPIRAGKKIHVIQKRSKKAKRKSRHAREENVLRSYDSTSNAKSVSIGGCFSKEDREKNMFWKQWSSAGPAPDTYDVDRAQRMLSKSGHIFFGTEKKCQVDGQIIEHSHFPGPQYFPHYSHVYPDSRTAVIKDPIPVVTVKRERQIDYMRASFGPRNGRLSKNDGMVSFVKKCTNADSSERSSSARIGSGNSQELIYLMPNQRAQMSQLSEE